MASLVLKSLRSFMCILKPGRYAKIRISMYSSMHNIQSEFVRNEMDGRGEGLSLPALKQVLREVVPGELILNPPPPACTACTCISH